MKHSEAANIVRGMLIGAQCSRSIAQENGYPDNLLAEIEPWLYGKQSCVPLLLRLVDEIDEGKQIPPVTFMNLLHIATATPTIGACALRYGYTIPNKEDIPMETYVGGWEPE